MEERRDKPGGSLSKDGSLSEDGSPGSAADRREFLRGWLRGLALAGLGLVSAVLVIRRAGSPGGDHCRQVASCKDCAEWDRCRLPQAAASRKPATR